MRALISVLLFALLATPATARLWNPTPQQLIADYVTITHIKGTEERVLLGWLASPVVASPTLKSLLDKYIVISIMHTRQTGGQVSWEQVQGVQVSDGDGQPLKQVAGDAIPPALVGLMAASDATMKQGTQGQGKIYWSVWETGSVASCQKSKLVVTYGGEAYSWDAPLPGCPKP